MARSSSSFLNRAFTRAFNLRGSNGDGKGALALSPDLVEADVKILKRQITACLSHKGGVVSARRRAAELGGAYLSLNETGRLRFFQVLARDFGVDRQDVDRASAALAVAEGEDDRRDARRRLKNALVAPRTQMFTQFNSLGQGVKFLVDMRADLLDALRTDPDLISVEEDLQQLLRSWFDVGFLEMAQITFNAPASLLEKLIEYEAVHEIRSWTDLKNRLDSDRRCFSFVHPNMPQEPLIFVEVALVNGIAGNVQALLDEDAPRTDPFAADTAIFYSISNCQRGLAGVGFGDFLIKRVVDRLSQRLPNLKSFATLSPIPGFMRWLSARAEAGDVPIRDAERKQIMEAAQLSADVAEPLTAALAWKDWHLNPALADALQPVLMRLGARYLGLERDRRERPIDPVARFHLNNGALIERVNWLADTSRSGMKQSAGMMVNYLYKLDDIEKNHESFRSDGTIATSSGVRRQLKEKW